MASTKPVLILQLRPEDVVADSEYTCFLKYSGLQAEDTCRERIENHGIPANLNLDDYSAIIVGGSPYDISTSEDKKSLAQKKDRVRFQQTSATGSYPRLPFSWCLLRQWTIG